jgi:hypothetical protein
MRQIAHCATELAGPMLEDCCSERVRGRARDVTLGRFSLYSGLSALLLPPDDTLRTELRSGTFFQSRRHWLSFLPEAKGLDQALDDLQACWHRVCRSGREWLQLAQLRKRATTKRARSSRADRMGVVSRSATTAAQLVELYGRFDLGLAVDLQEPVDHIGIELEFMAYVVSMEAYCLDTNQVGERRRCESGQIEMVTRFLGPDVRTLARRVERLSPESLCGRVSQLATAMLAWDSQWLGLDRVDGVP